METELDLASIMNSYRERFKERYSKQTHSEEWSAMNAIMGCRTDQYGDLVYACDNCASEKTLPRSCGHRACNKCQHNATSEWLARQENKLLPVTYYMVTFTLPKELRTLAKQHKRVVYNQLIRCAVDTLKTFGRNHRGFNSELAMTAVLHTHTRRLDYHPHVHIIVPAGGIHRLRREWREIRGKYLFNERNLAAKFRGAMLHALSECNLQLPRTPLKWIAQCKKVGRGLPALQYLSRYLYRGVISNKNIISDDGTSVTFRYTESKSGKVKTRTVPGEDFVRLVLQHTLPKGLRRARDFGFLHGNAKRTLSLIRYILKIETPGPTPRQKKVLIKCRKCKGNMHMVNIRWPKLMKIQTNSNFRLFPD